MGLFLAVYTKGAQPAASNTWRVSSLALSQSCWPWPRSAISAIVNPSVLMPAPPNMRRAMQGPTLESSSQQ
jgi:hypothetical protein